MKCPKCHYLSFEPAPRCRNCGFDLSMSDAAAPSDEFESPDAAQADLVLQAVESGTASSGLGHLHLATDAAERPAPLVRPRRRHRPEPPVAAGVTSGPVRGTETAEALMPAGDPEPVRPVETPVAAAPPARDREAAADPVPRPSVAPFQRAPTTELPLFVKGLPVADDEVDAPLVQVPPSPRQPLAVQRRTASLPRSSSPPPSADAFDRDLLRGLEHLERLEQRQAAAGAAAEATDRLATPGARLTAAVVDAGIIGGIGAAIVLLTLRWTGLPVNEAATLPWMPVAAFILLVAFGYLALFTAAGGQTIGKMTAGIRVIDDLSRETDPVTVRQALIRALLALPSVLVLGAGFLPALVGQRRALHDRLAQTRVVQA